MGNTLNHLIFRPHPASYSIKRKNLHFIKTKHDSTICGYFINNNADATILFSHGNAEDIGDLIPQFEKRLKHLKLNMFAYDYSGYGQSTGIPTETNIYNDVEAAYDYLTNTLKVHNSSIIAYGRSLGSAASVHIATKKELLGLILQSPLSSIHRVKLRLKFTLPYDLFCNIDKIHRIKCPILFIHGKKDNLISFKGTEEMIQKTKVNTYYMFIEDGGHNNLDTNFGYKINDALISFLFILKNNIRENVNRVYDISSININKLKGNVKKKGVEYSLSGSIETNKKFRKIKIINSSSKINECSLNKPMSYTNNSSKSMSTMLASIESVIKSPEQNTLYNNENSYETLKCCDNYFDYYYDSNTYDAKYHSHYSFNNKWSKAMKNDSASVKGADSRDNVSFDNLFKNKLSNVENIRSSKFYDKTIPNKNYNNINISNAKLVHHNNNNKYSLGQMNKIKHDIKNMTIEKKSTNGIKSVESNECLAKRKECLDDKYVGMSIMKLKNKTPVSCLNYNTKLFEKYIFHNSNKNASKNSNHNVHKIHNNNHSNVMSYNDIKNELQKKHIISSIKKKGASSDKITKKIDVLNTNFDSNNNNIFITNLKNEKIRIT